MTNLAQEKTDDYDYFDIYEEISTCESKSIFDTLKATDAKISRDNNGHWQLDWEYGSLGMIGPSAWSEAQAQCCAGMTIYLYLKGVPIDLAEEFGRAYVNYRSRRRAI